MKDYLARYYEKATIDQLADEYFKLGYSIKKCTPIGRFRADLLAEKDGQSIFFEVIKGVSNAEVRRRLSEMESLVNRLPNARFVVIPVRFSKEKIIRIEGIEDVLYNYMLNDFPEELDELSTHTSIDYIDSVDIEIIKVVGSNLVIKCSGIVAVILQYGSDDEQEGIRPMKMSFPFTFEGALTTKDKECYVSETDSLKIETSSFYR